MQGHNAARFRFKGDPCCLPERKTRPDEADTRGGVYYPACNSFRDVRKTIHPSILAVVYHVVRKSPLRERETCSTVALAPPCLFVVSIGRCPFRGACIWNSFSRTMKHDDVSRTTIRVTVTRARGIRARVVLIVAFSTRRAWFTSLFRALSHLINRNGVGHLRARACMQERKRCSGFGWHAGNA